MQLYACAGTIVCSYALVRLYMHNCTHLRRNPNQGTSCLCALVPLCMHHCIPLFIRALVLAQLHTLVHACSCAVVLLRIRALVRSCIRACTILCSCTVMHLCGCACMKLCSCTLVQLYACTFVRLCRKILMVSTAYSRRHRYESCCCPHGSRASRKPVPGACASLRCPVHGCSRCQS